MRFPVNRSAEAAPLRNRSKVGKRRNRTGRCLGPSETEATDGPEAGAASSDGSRAMSSLTGEIIEQEGGGFVGWIATPTFDLEIEVVSNRDE